jgi:hypothetical protein
MGSKSLLEKKPSPYLGRQSPSILGDPEKVNIVKQEILDLNKKTFRERDLPKSLGIMNTRSVLHYLLEINAINIHHRNTAYTRYIRNGLETKDTNMNHILKEYYNTKKRPSSHAAVNRDYMIGRKELFKILVSYLRWKRRLYSKFKAKYFRDSNGYGCKKPYYSDCILSNKEVGNAMIYAKTHGFARFKKKSHGSLWYLNKSFIENHLDEYIIKI